MSFGEGAAPADGRARSQVGRSKSSTTIYGRACTLTPSPEPGAATSNTRLRRSHNDRDVDRVSASLWSDILGYPRTPATGTSVRAYECNARVCLCMWFPLSRLSFPEEVQLGARRIMQTVRGAAVYHSTTVHSVRSAQCDLKAGLRVAQLSREKRVGSTGSKGGEPM